MATKLNVIEAEMSIAEQEQLALTFVQSSLSAMDNLPENTRNAVQKIFGNKRIKPLIRMTLLSKFLTHMTTMERLGEKEQTRKIDNVLAADSVEKVFTALQLDPLKHQQIKKNFNTLVEQLDLEDKPVQQKKILQQIILNQQVIQKAKNQKV